ncbi:LuxR C-terminal-related transcriptional regulator [Sphingomonas sp. HF-S4]|uniref:LuxR C-terminal-related transcriptional regulator n=1 Tax=Sphingomonas agrestis TaxID=3080540 RepID=A0ABU3Y606_9SPHN|nr:response regulator [Sphingomonas sp. HF-S4]MDV3456835.1 LuxR C-terminal-related transcriptional regulator [Sphingomonas sp. HF-S4]
MSTARQLKRNLYIVDDDDAVRHSLARLLGRISDCLVQCFASGSEFLARSPALAEGVLLLDLNMRGHNGMAVLCEVQPQHKYLPIILTGHGTVGHSVNAMKAGAFDFLEKPCDPVLLLDCLARGFEARALMCQAENGRKEAQLRLAVLSPREAQVLDALLDGLINKQIAHRLGISARTIEVYRANILRKLLAKTLAQAFHLVFAAYGPDGRVCRGAANG